MHPVWSSMIQSASIESGLPQYEQSKTAAFITRNPTPAENSTGLRLEKGLPRHVLSSKDAAQSQRPKASIFDTLRHPGLRREPGEGWHPRGTLNSNSPRNRIFRCCFRRNWNETEKFQFYRSSLKPTQPLKISIPSENPEGNETTLKNCFQEPEKQFWTKHPLVSNTLNLQR